MPPSEQDLREHAEQELGAVLLLWLRTEYRLVCARKVELKKLLDAFESA